MKRVSVEVVGGLEQFFFSENPQKTGPSVRFVRRGRTKKSLFFFCFCFFRILSFPRKFSAVLFHTMTCGGEDGFPNGH